MKVIRAQNKYWVSQFYEYPIFLNRDDPNFISPLISDVSANFTTAKEGDSAFFLAIDENKIIGRIAAFYPVDNNKGGLGFFDCIEDESVAFALFDTAIEWLTSAGFSEITAPVNFGQRDQFWGLLIESEGLPLYQENYHKKYYQSFFENYGFHRLYKQLTFECDLKVFNADRLMPLYQRSLQKGYSYRSIDLEEMESQAHDIASVYNEAWKHQDFFKPLQVSEILKMFRSIRFMLDPSLITLAYFGNEPVGIFASIPEINPYLKNFKGKIGWIGKLQLWLNIKLNPPSQAKGLIFGIVPEARNKGVDAGLIYATFNRMSAKRPYNEFFLSWIGDFNGPMLRLMEKIGARVVKTHFTYGFGKI